MSRHYLKLYFALFIILLLLIMTFLILNLRKSTQIGTEVLSPTPLIPSSIPPRIPSQIPVTIVPTFTGVKDEPLPQAIIDLSTQKQALRAKTPFSTIDFTITYDYKLDGFVVTLSPPQTQTKITFEDWLKQNFPAIPLSRFTFK